MALNRAAARRALPGRGGLSYITAGWLMTALLIALLLVPGTVRAHAETNDWTFRVLLDGRQIGRHRFLLRGEGDEDLELRSEMQVDVRVLLVTVYHYRHEAIERWHGNCLRSLVSHTDNNGTRESVNAAAEGELLTVERARAVEEHSGCIMSFAYWNPQILRARRLLNNETGELLPVSITPHGTETVTVHGEPLSASRYRISAPKLQIDLWYAGDLWVGLEAVAEGGRRLRYELM